MVLQNTAVVQLSNNLNAKLSVRHNICLTQGILKYRQVAAFNRVVRYFVRRQVVVFPNSDKTSYSSVLPQPFQIEIFCDICLQ